MPMKRVLKWSCLAILVLIVAWLLEFTSQNLVTYIAKPAKHDLKVVRELMQSGRVSPVIDRTYKIAQTANAVGHGRRRCRSEES
jgi:NADPH:quinone reductase-like Zn-dependent oxidoreductase